MIFTRYGNSRHEAFNSFFGHGHSWTYSFQYLMADGGVNDQGQAQLFVSYPEGGENIFVQDTQDPDTWLPLPGVNKRLFQDGTTFFLQLADGARCRFEKLLTSTGKTYYQLQEIRDSKQNLYTFTYNNARNLIRINEPAGRYFKIKYTKFNNLTVISAVTTNDNRSAKYHYSLINDGTTDWVVLDTVFYGDKTKAVYAYSQAEPGMWPNLEHAIDPRYADAHVNMKYTYDNADVGFIQQEFNGKTGDTMVTLTISSGHRIVCYPNSSIHDFLYPSKGSGNLGTYTDGLGRITKYVYADNGAGFMQRKTDSISRVTLYDSVSVYNNPLLITYPDKSKEKWTRDDLDMILTQTDELERVTTYTRDAKHRVIHIDYPDGSFEIFTYNQFGQVLDHTRRNSGIEHSVYDSRGLRTAFINALGDTTLYTYDGADRVASITDARGNTTRFLYNERGLLLKTTYADTSSKSYGYDTFGNQTTTTDELHHTWTTTYDEFRRTVTKTDPVGRTTQYFYNLPGGIPGSAHASNTPTKIISPGGIVTKIEYDVEWQKLSETVGAGSPDEATTSYEYDLVGNPVALIDPKDGDWTYEYDRRDRKTASMDPLKNRTEYSYDKAGNLLTTKRPDNGITSNIYDNMDRVIQITDPKGQVTKISYDFEGNMAALTDPKNHTYSLTYDLLNRKTKMTYPLGSFESYAYDQVGNLKTYTNREDNTRTYTYDKRNRETNSSWNDGNTPSISKTYDSAGKVLTIVSSVSALSYTYDNANQQTSETQSVAGTNVSKTVSYDYNNDGLRKAVIYPSGVIVKYRYNGRNLLDTIAVNNEPPIAVYAYDLNGNRLSKKLDNATITNYSYDSVNRMVSIDNLKNAVSFARFDYGYDNVNRREYMEKDGSKGDVYAYDAIDQVKGVQYNATNPNGTPSNPQRTVSYDWDSAGNRTDATDNGASTNYIANELNQYTTVGAILPGYDPNGNLTSFNGWTYAYDAQNRLTLATNGNNTVQCWYDPLNRCVKRIINGTTRYYYFDRWNIIQERSTADANLPRYINGAGTDEIIKKTTATDSFYCHYDALGSVVRLTNKNGNVIEKYSYDIFGAPTIQNSNGDTLAITGFGNRFMFTGREYIKEVKLFDYRNRIYSPALGRFLQTDPIGFDAGDYNLYRYVENNVVNETDPDGQITFNMIGGGGFSNAGMLSFAQGLAKLDAQGWSFPSVQRPIVLGPGYNSAYNFRMIGGDGFSSGGMLSFAQGLARATATGWQLPSAQRPIVLGPGYNTGQRPIVLGPGYRSAFTFRMIGGGGFSNAAMFSFAQGLARATATGWQLPSVQRPIVPGPGYNTGQRPIILR
jgi:RHS repeat-associated protein